MASGIRNPGAGVTCHCELPNIGAEILIIFCVSSMNPWLPKHFSSPESSRIISWLKRKLLNSILITMKSKAHLWFVVEQWKSESFLLFYEVAAHWHNTAERRIRSYYDYHYILTNPKAYLKQQFDLSKGSNPFKKDTNHVFIAIGLAFNNLCRGIDSTEQRTNLGADYSLLLTPMYPLTLSYFVLLRFSLVWGLRQPEGL